MSTRGRQWRIGKGRKPRYDDNFLSFNLMPPLKKRPTCNSPGLITFPHNAVRCNTACNENGGNDTGNSICAAFPWLKLLDPFIIIVEYLITVT